MPPVHTALHDSHLQAGPQQGQELGWRGSFAARYEQAGVIHRRSVKAARHRVCQALHFPPCSAPPRKTHFLHRGKAQLLPWPNHGKAPSVLFVTGPMVCHTFCHWAHGLPYFRLSVLRVLALVGQISCHEGNLLP